MLKKILSVFLGLLFAFLVCTPAGCAAIDSVRPFRFWADKAAFAADFHSENGACYYGKDE